ncbi:MAG: Fe-S cluster biosynthesis and repair protein YggX [Flavobacteriales bacterium]|jgi:Fe-S cluster biosynthesis and repair protein YggX
MSRTVTCRKYKKELPGLSAPPLPGPMGEELFKEVSSLAWQEWLEHQKMLINEKQLNLMDLTARNYLKEQMKSFLSGENFDEIEGYVAPSD